jgi:hypothetical protein
VIEGISTKRSAARQLGDRDGPQPEIRKLHRQAVHRETDTEGGKLVRRQGADGDYRGDERTERSAK